VEPKFAKIIALLKAFQSFNHFLPFLPNNLPFPLKELFFSSPYALFLFPLPFCLNMPLIPRLQRMNERWAKRPDYLRRCQVLWLWSCGGQPLFQVVFDPFIFLDISLYLVRPCRGLNLGQPKFCKYLNALTSFSEECQIDKWFQELFLIFA